MKNRWYSGAPVHVLHCFSTAAAAAAAVDGAASFCTYTNFLFHFPFDEIYLSASSPLSAFLLLLLLLLLLLVVLLPSVPRQNFIFHFPFDEIYRRLIFFTLGVLFPRE